MASKNQSGAYQLQASVPTIKGKTRDQYEPPVLRDAQFNNVFKRLRHVTTVSGLMWCVTNPYLSTFFAVCLIKDVQNSNARNTKASTT